jgi:hypothetical protein
VTGLGGSEQLPPQRTAQGETLPLNPGKRRGLPDLMPAYTWVQGGLLRALGRTPVWHHRSTLAPARTEVVRFLRRTWRQAMGRPPRVQGRRSFALDSTPYRVFSPKGRQSVSLGTGTPRGRCSSPLRGRGRVRVVRHPARGTVSAHVPYAVRVPAEAPRGPAGGLDAGVSEVLAAATGEQLGQGGGSLLQRLSEETRETGQAGNQLLPVAKKAEERGDAAKASPIRRNHLGRKTLQVKGDRGGAAVKTAVGQAGRQALRSRPAVVALEDLAPLRGQRKSRKRSRIVVRWMRSTRRGRLEFWSRAGDSRLEKVNAAYTSQACLHPACGSVHRDNRHGDRLPCGCDGDADTVTALNPLTGVGDPEIQRWTPVDEAQRILEGRCRSWQETGNGPGDPPGVGNGTPLPAGLHQRRRHPVPSRA